MWEYLRAIPGGENMENSWNTTLWLQFGAAIDMLENALLACPTPLWTESVWHTPADHPQPPKFWYVTYHTLFWLDLYLSGCREEDFTPPAPFSRTELDPAAVVSERPYTKEELHSYLKATRQKCHTTLLTLSDEQARQTVVYPWAEGKNISFSELQLYSMRHVQEHAAQLSLFLGQHSIPDEALDWVPRAKDES